MYGCVCICIGTCTCIYMCIYVGWICICMYIYNNNRVQLPKSQGLHPVVHCKELDKGFLIIEMSLTGVRVRMFESFICENGKSMYNLSHL